MKTRELVFVYLLLEGAALGLTWLGGFNFERGPELVKLLVFSNLLVIALIGVLLA